jgi:PAS domain-containing protein/uncharacterized protein YihD (DUF1040 family)
MKKINFQSIKTRLIVSFSSMAMLIVIVVFLTLFQMGNIMQVGNNLLENKQPSRIYLETMKSGVNNSNVMLQTYLLIGDAEYQDKNEAIWEKEINPANDTLELLKERWENASHLILLEKISRLAERIKVAQITVINQASFEVTVPGVDLYAFEAIQNDTLFEYSDLQSWIDEQLNSKVDNNANGDLFINHLASISQEYNLLSDELFKALQKEAAEIGEEILNTRERFLLIETVIVIIAVLLCFLLFRFVLTNTLGSIQKVHHTVTLLGQGNIPETHQQTEDELNNILIEIGYLSDNLKNVQKFALEVGKGNFNNNISVFNNEGDIGSSLAEMRNSLKTVSEEAVVRNWSNKGFAEFGDILRKFSENLAELSDHVITYMVKYLNANQGSLFIVTEDEDDKKKLVLTATYAYDRKKFIHKTIEPGQGLVGQVYLEKESIYLKDIPENYVTITSGLGKANPKSIFIMPLIVNQELFGVIEIGSFHELKDYEREFLEKISENIASSIQAVKGSERTRKLLDDSQQMTEQMRSQEEEMRQNMEELQATQEEMERTQRENNDRLEALEKSGTAYIEFSPQGEILYADKVFLKLFEYNNIDEIKGKLHRIFVDDSYRESEEYVQFWQNLSAGVAKEGIFERFTQNGKKIFIKGTYINIKNNRGEIIKIVKLAVDVTSLIQESTVFQLENEALLADIQALQAQLETNAGLSKSQPESLDQIRKLQHDLNADLKLKLSNNEEQLKKSLEQQRRKLGL